MAAQKAARASAPKVSASDLLAPAAKEARFTLTSERVEVTRGVEVARGETAQKVPSLVVLNGDRESGIRLDAVSTAIVSAGVVTDAEMDALLIERAARKS